MEITAKEIFEGTVRAIEAIGTKPNLPSILDMALFETQGGSVHVENFMYWFSVN